MCYYYSELEGTKENLLWEVTGKSETKEHIFHGFVENSTDCHHEKYQHCSNTFFLNNNTAIGNKKTFHYCLQIDNCKVTTLAYIPW